MVKKIVKLIVVVLFVSYGCWSLPFTRNVVMARQCNHIRLEILDVETTRLIDTKEILNSIEKEALTPLNKSISELNLLSIENKILSNQVIKSAICYHSTSGDVHIQLSQISPILRIMIGNQSWFLDVDGRLVELNRIYPYKVQVASGNIDYKYVNEYLYPFALKIYQDDFWRSQIQQIVITEHRECILIPLVGDVKIEMGELTNSHDKLEKLKIFFRTIPSKVGWNYYASVNIKYNNQIVCKRR